MIVLETALGPLDADSEAAESETQSKLDYDVRFWLGESNGDVRIVFTLKVDRKTPTVIINKWEFRHEQPHRTQHVEVKKGESGHVAVSGGPLIIEFDKLFLLQPNFPKETDIELDAETLRSLAISIW